MSQEKEKKAKQTPKLKVETASGFIAYKEMISKHLEREGLARYGDGSLEIHKIPKMAKSAIVAMAKIKFFGLSKTKQKSTFLLLFPNAEILPHSTEEYNRIGTQIINDDDSQSDDRDEIELDEIEISPSESNSSNKETVPGVSERTNIKISTWNSIRKIISTLPSTDYIRKYKNSEELRRLVPIHTKSEYDIFFSPVVWFSIMIDEIMQDKDLSESEAASKIIEEGLNTHMTKEEKENYQKAIAYDSKHKSQYIQEKKEYKEDLDKHKKVIRLILDGLSEAIKKR